MTMTCSRNSCGRLTWLTVLYVQVKSLISMATTDSGGPIPHRRTSMREPSVTWTSMGTTHSWVSRFVLVLLK